MASKSKKTNILLGTFYKALDFVKQNVFVYSDSNVFKDFNIDQLLDMESFIKNREKEFAEFIIKTKTPSEWDRFYGEESPMVSAYNKTVNLEYIRFLRYLDYEQMELTVPEISSGLDYYADYIVQQNQNTGSYLETAPQFSFLDLRKEDIEQIQIEINILSEQWGLNDVSKLRRIIRETIKLGDYFVRTPFKFDENYNPIGILDIVPISPYAIDIITDPNDFNKIISYKFNPKNMQYVAMRYITVGGSFAGNTTAGINNTYDALGNSSESAIQIFTPLEMHHFYVNKNVFAPFGTSLLEGIRKIWKQLMMLEDAMVYWRLVNGVQRKVFKIDVGNLPEEKATEYVRKIRNSLRKQPFVPFDTNKDTMGNLNWTADILAQDENIWIPVRTNSSTSIETLPEVNNTGMIDSLNYLKNKIFSKLRIPKAYLGSEEDINAKGTLLVEDAAFAKLISKLQSIFSDQIWDVFKVHFYLQKNLDKILGVKLVFSSMDSILEKNFLDSLEQRINLASTALGLFFQLPDGNSVPVFNYEYILRVILKLPETEIVMKLQEIDSVLKSIEENKKYEQSQNNVGVSPSMFNETLHNERNKLPNIQQNIINDDSHIYSSDIENQNNSSYVNPKDSIFNKYYTNKSNINAEKKRIILENLREHLSKYNNSSNREYIKEKEEIKQNIENAIKIKMDLDNKKESFIKKQRSLL